jgi:transposase
MAKSKKKKKKKGHSFLDAIHPFISDDRVLRGIFDAALAGIAWVAAREARKSATAANEAAEETQTLVEDQTNK